MLSIKERMVPTWYMGKVSVFEDSESHCQVSGSFAGGAVEDSKDADAVLRRFRAPGLRPLSLSNPLFSFKIPELRAARCGAWRLSLVK